MLFWSWSNLSRFFRTREWSDKHMYVLMYIFLCMFSYYIIGPASLVGVLHNFTYYYINIAFHNCFYDYNILKNVYAWKKNSIALIRYLLNWNGITFCIVFFLLTVNLKNVVDLPLWPTYTKYFFIFRLQ